MAFLQVCFVHGLLYSLHPVFSSVFLVLSFVLATTSVLSWAIKRKKANWIGHNLRRKSLLKHIIEEKIGARIEVTGRKEEDVISY
jgi:hypothetical protein